MVALAASACTSKRRTQKDLQEPERGGNTLEPISFRYADARPTVSVDGTKIVFISGRDSSDALSASKAYKAEWEEGGEPTVIGRVTIDDSVGIEKDAWISPDGAYVLLLAANGARTDLYLQDYAGTKAPARITDDDALESHPTFSPDGKLIAWIVNDKATKTWSAKVVEIGDASAETLAKQTVVSAEGRTPKQLFWLPADAGYRLVVASTGAAEQGSSYGIRTFASFADIESASEELWFAAFTPDVSVQPVAVGENVLFSRRVNDPNLVVAKIGTAATEGTVLHAPVASEPAFAPTTGEPLFGRYENVLGMQTLGFGLTADGLTGVYLERHFYRCTDGVDQYGTAFVVAPLDPADPGRRIVPKLDSDHVHLLQGDFCDLKVDGYPSWLDDKIAEMAMPASSTTSKFRVIYTTRFTTKFDRDCLLRSGDTEIMAFESKDDTVRFYEISQNRAPLQNADRGSSAPCSL